MDHIEVLLARANLAGLEVRLAGERIEVSGPRSASMLVAEIASHKDQVLGHLRKNQCGSLHIRPEAWVRREGKAYCPRCGLFKGCFARV
jgi:hypothetical protein